MMRFTLRPSPATATLGRLIAQAALALMLAVLSSMAHAQQDLRGPMRDLIGDDPDKRIAAIYAIGLSEHPLSKEILEALGEEGLFVSEDSSKIFMVREKTVTDIVSGRQVTAVPPGLESVMINNAMRSAIDLAKAATSLGSKIAAERKKAARNLQVSEDASLQPILEAALKKEVEADVTQELRIAIAALVLQFGKGTERANAVAALSASDQPSIRQKLSQLLVKNADGSFAESDTEVRKNAELALKAIQARLTKFEIALNLFSGISLASILLLVALGLAITYGLMGVINMAHGEFLMIGAYVTYLTQTAFRTWWPEAISLYVLAAIPVAFLVTGALGVVLERTILRWLYGRPLETLLTTWGVSLLLMQMCRSLFGAQNVEVENPYWLSGGITLAADMIIPWNRIVILGFSAAVLIAVALLITRTRAGLYIRGVTQNRQMAACTGVATDRVDMLTFGFGSAIAGLGGVALSQIGNVGPDLGQQYIVDSFMVVVLGGVGQLAGTVIAAIGLGSITKLLEPMSGAVLAKITVLIFIILFIQKRPQGLFALKGRSAET